jgi:presenilin-like A22 family membrane protease
MSKLNVLLTQLFLFILVQLLGIYVASTLIFQKPELIEIQQISLLAFFAIFALSVAIIFLAMRFLKHKFGFKMLFVFLIVVGSKSVFSSMFSETISTILSLVVVGLWVAIPYVYMHNIAIILSVSGIAAELGFAMSFANVIILISVLSVYDVIAVYQTKHMIRMFKGMVNKGLLLAIIVPFKRKLWLTKTETVKPKKGFLLLGTGDLAFPLILAVSAVKYSIISSYFIAIGATFGAGIVFYLLVNQQQHKAIPALPPIAVCSILGFLVSLLII